MKRYVTTEDFKVKYKGQQKEVNQLPKIGVTRDPITLKKERFYPDQSYLKSHIVKRPWEGKRCFIIGGGPSLKNFDFSNLKGELVISVNRSHKDFPMAAFCMFLDERFFGWSSNGTLGDDDKNKFDNFAGYKVSASRVAFPYPDDINVVDWIPGKDLVVSDDISKGIYCGSNSGFSACMLAIALGVKEIYLLGFDMNVGNGNQRQSWYHEGYPEKQDATVYQIYINDFERAASKIKEAGVRVVNLNRNSGLKCFEFGDIGTLKKPNRPLIVSFYTPNYTDLAKRMIRSAQLFGFEHDVVQIESKGSWIDTIYYRANFIKEMLLKHKRDVVWLDCDAVIQRYPEMFDDFNGDFGVHYHEWKDRGRELLGGTMYFANNKSTMQLIDKWIHFNDSMPKQNLSQKVLQAAVEHWNGKVVQLPANYTQIFDLMADSGEPIIEHFQASRNFRNNA